MQQDERGNYILKKLIAILVMTAVLFSAAALAGERGSSGTEETDPFHFSTFGEAVEAANGEHTITAEYAATLLRSDGRFFRAVAFFDDRAKELYTAFNNAWTPGSGDFPREKHEALQAYIMTLPVQYTEELTVIPFSQEELDAMAGKTLEDVMSEPWEMQIRNYPEDAEAGKDVVFRMVKVFCEYELTINEPFEVYQERFARDRYDPGTIMSLKNYLDLTVREVKYTGISNNVSDLRYRADGTLERDTEPFPEGYDYDLMLEIADFLTAAWENGEPDGETKEAMIEKLTEEHPEAADMIRQMVESFH